MQPISKGVYILARDKQSIRNMVKACSKYQPAQPKLQLMQPDFSIHSWATLGMDINKQDRSKYLLVVDSYSSIPVVQTLPDTSVTTVYEQFTKVLTAYGLPITIIADCGSQYMSDMFQRECYNSNITYHHQRV